jgi:PKD repeat protein
MVDTTAPARGRRRRSILATAALAVLVALPAGAGPASASSGPVPDFDDTPTCIADILAISCSVKGTATGGKIVTWEWTYPGAFSNVAFGKQTVLRFNTTGVFDVTLTVTDQQDQTGSVTKPMFVEING